MCNMKEWPRVPILQVSPWILWCFVEMGCTSWCHSDAWCMGCWMMFFFVLYNYGTFKALTQKHHESQILISKSLGSLPPFPFCICVFVCWCQYRGYFDLGYLCVFLHLPTPHELVASFQTTLAWYFLAAWLFAGSPFRKLRSLVELVESRSKVGDLRMSVMAQRKT